MFGKNEAADNTVTIRRLGIDKQEVKPSDEALKQFKVEARYPSVEYDD